jgi:hypothetical protein
MGAFLALSRGDGHRQLPVGATRMNKCTASAYNRWLHGPTRPESHDYKK